MIQVYKSIIIFSLYAFTLCACSNKNSSNINENIKNDSVDVDNKHYFHKIDSFVNLYDVKEDERLRLENSKQPYSIDDSLCNYMSSLDKRELIEDDCFRSLMGKLLEKKYLGVRNSGLFDPESFPVYNMSIVTYYRVSNRFALNILLKEKMDIDSSFVKYAAQLPGEFYCIDSVVLTIDKLLQMQNDSNHQKCMYLVTNNKTGGCKW